MPEIKLVECPRDAWQGLKGQIPTDMKVAYLRALVAAGFKHIDAVSFVSPKAVPQMADSEEVLIELDPPDDVEIIGIVVNEKGAQRAIESKGVRTLGFPYSISETFLRKNQNQSPEDALGGLGGCPFAQDGLVGNIPTEKLIETLKGHGAELPPLKPLDTLLRATAEIGARYTNSTVET